MNLTKQLVGTTLCILIFLCISTSANAQFKKIKLGEIPDEFKNYTACDFSPGSGAVVLINKGESYFEFTQTGYNTYYRFHKFIKILNKDGLDAGDITFVESGKITTLKATTYNLKNRKWIGTEFDKKNLYKEKIKGNRTLSDYKIPMPNVSEGSIIELLIEVRYTNSLFVPAWYFQEEIPVLCSSYITTYPADFIFKKEIRSYFQIKQGKPVEKFLYIGTNKLNAYEYSYIAKEIPPLDLDEKYAPNPYVFASNIDFNLSEIRSQLLKETQFYPKNYLSLSKWYLKSESFGAYIAKNKSGLLKKLEIEITAEEDVKTRATKIYKTIQDKITWDEYYSSIPDKSPSKTVKDATGEVADINMLLISALREAGLKAYPLLASTRENGIPGTLGPSQGEFNYLLCVLKINEKDVILDASMEGLPFGMIPDYVLNKSGYLIDLVRYGWVPIQDSAKHERIYVANLRIEEGQLVGSIMAKLNHYAAYDYYTSLEDEKEITELKENFKKNIAAEWEWEDLNFNEMTIGKAITTKGNISKEIEVEDLIYIEPVIFKLFNENPFKNEKRIAPIDIPYQLKYRMLFNLEIPKGYALEEMPESTRIIMPEEKGVFTYAVGGNEKKVSINISFNLSTVNYKVDEYDILHSFFAQIHEHLENMVVLKQL